jgi:hypothetical protein
VGEAAGLFLRGTDYEADVDPVRRAGADAWGAISSGWGSKGSAIAHG